MPKATFRGIAVRLPCTPAPLIGIDKVELLAVLEIVMLPDAPPEVVGVNCAVKLTV